MRAFILTILLSALFHACGTRIPADGALADLLAHMTGSFDSRTQAEADSNYYAISLHMYPIWEGRPGTWLYIEQAIFATQDRPYRQRVYQLESLGGGRFASHVYELPEPESFVGAYAEPARFNTLTAEMLTERQGCTVYLERQADGNYRGSTKDDHCLSSLRGASYATSRVSIGSNFIQSWDQGWNADSEQVWGATEGGYLFLRNN